MTEMKYLTNRQMATLKGRLTRAKKKGPRAVILEVTHAYEVFDDHVWPDSWHTWDIASRDAEHAIRRDEWSSTSSSRWV